MKVVKRILVVVLSVVLLLAAAAVSFYFVSTAGASLDRNKLESTESAIEIYDKDNEKIAEVSLKSANKSVRIEKIPDHVKNAFIAAEDKNFYSHHGLDYKGMARALFKNIKARSFKQGASTISQQLIKNTQLSSEKTLTRKLKEIKLTKQLEKKYSKEQILGMYLNTIYFGHACYGIAGAADFYFGKNAEELNTAEAATLAALIRSPNNYSPFTAPEKCLSARNRVLQRMFALGHISESDCEKAKAEPLPQKNDNSIASKTYLSAVYAEMESIPFHSPYEFRKGCKIYTYMDSALQGYTENLKTDADRSGKSVLVCDNKTNGISAWYTTEGDIRRQPGSIIKPLAVYAPAVEENLISPCTPLLDEKTSFGEYSPANYKDIYRGYVSARQALAESLNIPAVKVLNMLGTEKSVRYLNKMGLNLKERDKNLSLALGGISEGYTLREIAGAYTVFANGGNFTPPALIRKIEDSEGAPLYERECAPLKVFSEDSAALINNMLGHAAKSGTAKKLASLPYEVCAKTGTCGTEKGNTDAWCVSYTSAHTVAVWMGNADNTLTNITGGGLPCHYAMLLNKKIYEHGTPSPFETESQTVECRLDKISYERDHIVKLAGKHQPDQFTMTDIFRASNQPKETSDIFDSPASSAAKISLNKNTVYIELCQTEYYNYLIKRRNDGKEIVLFDGKTDGIFQDKNIEANTKYVYTIQPYFTDENGEKIFGKEIALPSVYTKQTNASLPDRWWK